MLANNTLARKHLESASIFSELFAPIYHFDDLRPVSQILIHVLYVSNLTIVAQRVQAYLERLSAHNSAGHGVLHSQLMKNLVANISGPLVSLFTNTLEIGEISTACKTAAIKPNYKKDPKHDTANYRPVILDSICWKVMGRFIHDRILV